MSINLSDNNRAGTFNFGKPGIAEGTNAATIQIAAATEYSIDGIMYQKAITDNIALTAADAQADLTTCLYLITINAAGTVASVKGTEVLTANMTGGDDVLVWPQPAEGYCPVGVIQVATSGITFTAGTTDLGAAGVTDIYRDLHAVPARPIATPLT